MSTVLPQALARVQVQIREATGLVVVVVVVVVSAVMRVWWVVAVAAEEAARHEAARRGERVGGEPGGKRERGTQQTEEEGKESRGSKETEKMTERFVISKNAPVKLWGSTALVSFGRNRDPTTAREKTVYWVT